jgi:hypothetical protein
LQAVVQRAIDLDPNFAGGYDGLAMSHFWDGFDADPKGPPQVRDLKVAGGTLRLQIISANASRPEEIEEALRVLANEKVEVTIVLQTNLLLLNRSSLAASALQTRLPAVCGYRGHGHRWRAR